MDQNPSSSKADRKTIEKNRRNHMKALYAELNSLVPHPNPLDTASLQDQLQGATDYIKMLQANLEEMKRKKHRLMEMPGNARSGSGLNLPNIDIRATGCALEVVLITGRSCQFMFNEVIRLLHEEGAEVVSAGFSVLDDTVFHTVHSKIGEPAQDYEAARISQRLKKFVHNFI